MPKLSVPSEFMEELFEEPATYLRKVEAIAKEIKGLQARGKPFVIFTGAGISTAAKIPDYRGPNGVWTRRDKGLSRPKGIAFELAQPTYTHRAIARLVELGICDLVVSQNVDGLHMRSGIPDDKLCELHGNTFKETCVDCGRAYLRDKPCRRVKGSYFKGVKDVRSQSGISHITGRRCVVCRKEPGKTGMLRDSIIHFKENLPEDTLEKAWQTSKQAGVVLCLGSSLRVTPAADIPFLCQRKPKSGRVHIVNLQRTSRDHLARGEVIHAKCDEVMAALMAALGVDLDDDTSPSQSTSTTEGAAVDVDKNDPSASSTRSVSETEEGGHAKPPQASPAKKVALSTST